MKHRPFSVTLLGLGVLTIAMLHLLRMILTQMQYEFLARLLPITPLYLILSGAAWSVVGILLFVGLFFGREWAPLFTRLAALAFSASLWVERLLLANPQVQSANLGFAIGANLVLVVLVFWVTLRGKARLFFGAGNGRSK